MVGVGEFGVVLAAAGAGAGLGAGVRLLLRRLRRGVVLPAGPTETAGALTAGVSVAVAWAEPTLGLVLLAGLLMVALSGVDIVHHRLPDAITLPALPLTAVVLAVTRLFAPGSGSLIRALVIGLLLWAVFAGLARISASWMGRGDVKLIPTLGLLMGYPSAAAAFLGLAVAFLLGSLVAVAGLISGRLRLRSAIPLGPCLLFGCWSVLLFPAYLR